jgi:hypothetical protein
VNSSNRVGCIGFKSFFESIGSICKELIDDLKIDDYQTFEEKKSILDKKAEEIAHILGSAWNYVFGKWPIFRESWVTEGYEQFVTYYNEEYYLQRTMGTFAINSIICACIKGPSFNRFFEIIDDCTLSVEDWHTMGMFSGISSLSGANKIKEKILEGYINKKGSMPF